MAKQLPVGSKEYLSLQRLDTDKKSSSEMMSLALKSRNRMAGLMLSSYEGAEHGEIGRLLRTVSEEVARFRKSAEFGAVNSLPISAKPSFATSKLLSYLGIEDHFINTSMGDLEIKAVLLSIREHYRRGSTLQTIQSLIKTLIKDDVTVEVFETNPLAGSAAHNFLSADIDMDDLEKEGFDYLSYLADVKKAAYLIKPAHVVFEPRLRWKESLGYSNKTLRSQKSFGFGTGWRKNFQTVASGSYDFGSGLTSDITIASDILISSPPVFFDKPGFTAWESTVYRSATKSFTTATKAVLLDRRTAQASINNAGQQVPVPVLVDGAHYWISFVGTPITSQAQVATSFGTRLDPKPYVSMLDGSEPKNVLTVGSNNLGWSSHYAFEVGPDPLRSSLYGYMGKYSFYEYYSLRGPSGYSVQDPSGAWVSARSKGLSKPIYEPGTVPEVTITLGSIDISDWVSTGYRLSVDGIDLRQKFPQHYLGASPVLLTSGLSSTALGVGLVVKADGITSPATVLIREANGYTQIKSAIPKAVISLSFTPAFDQVMTDVDQYHAIKQLQEDMRRDWSASLAKGISMLVQTSGTYLKSASVSGSSASSAPIFSSDLTGISFLYPQYSRVSGSELPADSRFVISNSRGQYSSTVVEDADVDVFLQDFDYSSSLLTYGFDVGHSLNPLYDTPVGLIKIQQYLRAFEKRLVDPVTGKVSPSLISLQSSKGDTILDKLTLTFKDPDISSDLGMEPSLSTGLFVALTLPAGTKIRVEFKDSSESVLAEIASYTQTSIRPSPETGFDLSASLEISVAPASAFPITAAWAPSLTPIKSGYVLNAIDAPAESDYYNIRSSELAPNLVILPSYPITGSTGDLVASSDSTPLPSLSSSIGVQIRGYIVYPEFGVIRLPFNPPYLKATGEVLKAVRAAYPMLSSNSSLFSSTYVLATHHRVRNGNFGLVTDNENCILDDRISAYAPAFLPDTNYVGVKRVFDGVSFPREIGYKYLGFELANTDVSSSGNTLSGSVEGTTDRYGLFFSAESDALNLPKVGGEYTLSEGTRAELWLREGQVPFVATTSSAAVFRADNNFTAHRSSEKSQFDLRASLGIEDPTFTGNVLFRSIEDLNERSLAAEDGGLYEQDELNRTEKMAWYSGTKFHTEAEGDHVTLQSADDSSSSFGVGLQLEDVYYPDREFRVNDYQDYFKEMAKVVLFSGLKATFFRGSTEVALNGRVTVPVGAKVRLNPPTGLATTAQRNYTITGSSEGAFTIGTSYTTYDSQAYSEELLVDIYDPHIVDPYLVGVQATVSLSSWYTGPSIYSTASTGSTPARDCSIGWYPAPLGTLPGYSLQATTQVQTIDSGAAGFTGSVYMDITDASAIKIGDIYGGAEVTGVGPTYLMTLVNGVHNKVLATGPHIEEVTDSLDVNGDLVRDTTGLTREGVAEKARLDSFTPVGGVAHYAVEISLSKLPVGITLTQVAKVVRVEEHTGIQHAMFNRNLTVGLSLELKPRSMISIPAQAAVLAAGDDISHEFSWVAAAVNGYADEYILIKSSASTNILVGDVLIVGGKPSLVAELSTQHGYLLVKLSTALQTDSETLEVYVQRVTLSKNGHLLNPGDLVTGSSVLINGSLYKAKSLGASGVLGLSYAQTIPEGVYEDCSLMHTVTDDRGVYLNKVTRAHTIHDKEYTETLSYHTITNVAIAAPSAVAALQGPWVGRNFVVTLPADGLLPGMWLTIGQDNRLLDGAWNVNDGGISYRVLTYRGDTYHNMSLAASASYVLGVGTNVRLDTYVFDTVELTYSRVLFVFQGVVATESPLADGTDIKLVRVKKGFFADPSQGPYPRQVPGSLSPRYRKDNLGYLQNAIPVIRGLSWSTVAPGVTDPALMLSSIKALPSTGINWATLGATVGTYGIIDNPGETGDLTSTSSANYPYFAANDQYLLNPERYYFRLTRWRNWDQACFNIDLGTTDAPLLEEFVTLATDHGTSINRTFWDFATQSYVTMEFNGALFITSESETTVPLVGLSEGLLEVHGVGGYPYDILPVPAGIMVKKRTTVYRELSELNNFSLTVITEIRM